MMVGLAAAIGIMILEMVLYIIRAVRIEESTEGKHSEDAVRLAKIRSGSLVTDVQQGKIKNS